MKTETDWYKNAVSIPADNLNSWGTTLIIAPHQDDESLGCGGTIALLRSKGVPVHVLFTSDGSMSHPNSKKYSAEKLMLLRENEALNALKILGVERDNVTFMRLKDSNLPNETDVGFKEAADKAAVIINKVNPGIIMLPWRRDPHKDHRATWQIIMNAAKRISKHIRVFEYFIWLWERAVKGELPEPGEGKIWNIDIRSETDKKTKAIAAHISQTTNLIKDDPEGFTLSQHMLANFSGPAEFYFETIKN